MAVEAHADEIDMVMNVSAFKTGDYAAVVSDILQRSRGGQSVSGQGDH